MQLYMQYKEFLDELTPQHERQRLEKIKQQKNLAKQKAKGV